MFRHIKMHVYFSVKFFQGNNASKEINASINYPNIRVMTPALVWSDFPLDDFQKIEQPWSIASPG